ncbi:MAG: SCO1664 family protein [Acidimicrobiales bacterium]
MPAYERPQRAAHLTGGPPDQKGGAGLSPREWLELLSAGAIEIEGRLPWSSNYSFLATVTLEDRSAGAVYKPGKGERPLWDFGTEIYRREIAAYELSAAFGFDLVPETVLRLDGPLEHGSLQRFVDADFEQHYFTLLENEGLHPRLRELAGLDLLLNNADRKSGHVLIDSSGSIWGIDNGLCFHPQPKLRTVIWEFAGEPVPDSVIAACCEIAAGGVPARVAALLGEPECAGLARRAELIVRTARFPAPRDDHRAYPWPLV